MRFLLFGTGDYYGRYKKWFPKRDIVALLDNAAEKQHTVIDGLEVLSPEEGIRLDYDVIVILSFYVGQMRRQLLSLGVDEERIVHFYGLRRLLGSRRPAMPVRYYPGAGEAEEPEPTGRPGILLMSNELTLGGPPIALFHAAMALKRARCRVACSSMTDGPLRERFTENGIPVIVDENLQLSTMRETAWVHAFQIIICNTLNFHVFLSERDTRIHIIWWLHDARFFYDGVDVEVMRQISMENLQMLSVGPVPEAAVKEFIPEADCGRLLYGVSDVCGGAADAVARGEVCFITIGFLEDIKGQDVLVEAVKRLPENIRGRCRFYIVGHDGTMFGDRIRRECAGIREVVFTGSVGRDEIHRFLSASDVLVCPSRQDSMPTVAAEAMMHGVPCLISDATGTAAYIQDGVDGMVFRSGDVGGLSDKIIWCAMHREELKGMGMGARKIYESHFSTQVFEKNLLSAVARSLGHAEYYSCKRSPLEE